VKSSQSAATMPGCLMSAALVLMMTAGLALFYSGLVRKRNVLGTMMQSFAMNGRHHLVWAVCGYQPRLLRGQPLHRGLRYLFLQGWGPSRTPRMRPPFPTRRSWCTSSCSPSSPRRSSPVRSRSGCASPPWCSSRRYGPFWFISLWRTWCGATRFPNAYLAAAAGLRFRRRHGGPHHLRLSAW